MPVITISPVNLQANILAFSAGHQLTASTKSIQINMTDGNGNETPAANSDWLKTVGNVKIWGLQVSTDGGVTWSWGPVFQGDMTDQTQWIPFGSLAKNGQLPFLSITSSGLVQDVGDQLRLAAEVDTTIKLGAIITVN